MLQETSNLSEWTAFSSKNAHKYEGVTGNLGNFIQQQDGVRCVG